jgi:hypothetical protein
VAWGRRRIRREEGGEERRCERAYVCRGREKEEEREIKNLLGLRVRGSQEIQTL